ncbi:ABC transporter permease [Imperialibacter roseus]|uniref:ABC transporter permease n=1 Tax=Imperialibacter roseus TaxID=1324217 RepID=A0ABZ0IRB1_9BACT|nr:ABC transporter permease [Imperialibacter roseus]WOK07534.1 ABC transporter permease [Imperialibacter roseus]
MSNRKIHPPRLADRFLRWFCSDEVLETLQGDLYELYEKRREKKGEFLADIYYAFDVLSALRPFALEKKRSNSNYTTMFHHYLTISWRNLRVNRLYSLLNISGLAVGLACGILILLWISHELSYDTFHRNQANIYQLMRHEVMSGEYFTGDVTPAPLGPSLKSGMPEVLYATRTLGAGKQLVNAGHENTYEAVLYADPDFFNIMTFPSVTGNAIEALNSPGSVVITERTAKKLFEHADPIGKAITVNNTDEFLVAAVIRDVPTNSSIRFDIVIPFSTYEQNRHLKWDNNSFQTWILLAPATNLLAFNEKIDGMVEEHLDNEEVHLFAFPLERLHLYNHFANGRPDGGKIDFVYLVGALGVFILLLACVNFMNLATARSERRAKEVGIRKVIGAQRRIIVGQFLTEAMMITFFGLFLSVIAVKLVLPSFNELTGKDLSMSLANWRLWSSVLLLGWTTGMLAGSYPAFFLSGFKPVQAIAGLGNTVKGASIFRRVLVTFQFFVSIFLIISTIVIYVQLEHIQGRPLGYDQETLIELPMRGDMGKAFEVFKNDLLQLQGVTGVSAGGDNLIKVGGGVTGFQWPGKGPDEDFPVNITSVHYDWIKTTGLTMAEGRDFSPEYGTDSLACLINETAVRRMRLEQPVGTHLGEKSYIVGVVKDFVFNDPTSDPEPLVIYLGTNQIRHIFIRFENDHDWQQRLGQIEQIFEGYFPAYPFEVHFTKDEYQKRFEVIRSMRGIAILFSGLAIFIACLGLIGLSAYVAERRKKEVGIRKVLGATISNISIALSLDFLKPVFLSFLLAAPLAGWLLDTGLDNIDYRIELSWWIFALAGGVAFTLACLMVSYHAIKASTANPVESLRRE